FLSTLAPKLMRVNLAEESRKLEATLNIAPEAASSSKSAYRPWVIRAFHLPDAWVGRTVGDVERSFQPERVFIERVRRRDELIDASPEARLEARDVIAVSARRHVFFGESQPFGAFSGPTPFGVEVNDQAWLDFPVDALDVVLTNRALDDRTLADVAELHG